MYKVYLTYPGKHKYVCVETLAPESTLEYKPDSPDDQFPVKKVMGRSLYLLINSENLDIVRSDDMQFYLCPDQDRNVRDNGIRRHCSYARAVQLDTKRKDLERESEKLLCDIADAKTVIASSVANFNKLTEKRPTHQVEYNQIEANKLTILRATYNRQEEIKLKAEKVKELEKELLTLKG